MPLKLMLGLSKKIGEPHYGSRGASFHLEVEVDSSLLNDPDRLREHVRTLYRHIRTSLTEEINGRRTTANMVSPSASASDTGCVASYDSMSTSTGSPPARLATPLQVRAIERMANQFAIDLTGYLEKRAGVVTPANLTLPQASQIIDELRTITAREGFTAVSPDESMAATSR
jgi:hypothetical protein